MHKSILGWSGVALAVVLFFSLNLIANQTLRTANIDLTADRLFTISDGTGDVLEALDEPITLRFFFSQDLAGSVPSIRGYAKRVEDLLKTFAQQSDGMIRLQVIDPEPFSSDEDQAVAYGVQGVPLDASGAQFYFGLVGSNTVGDRDVIPFFQQNKESFLEYDLIRMVQSLSATTKPVIGLMTSLPVDGMPGNPQFGQQGTPPWSAIDSLVNVFDVRRIETSATIIDPDIRVLVLLHPAGLEAATLYAIDQFVMSGGRLVIFDDPYSEAAATANQMGAMSGGPRVPLSSDLATLYDAWGINTADGVFIGDLGQAQRVNAPVRNQPGTTRAVEYLAWQGVRDDQINRDDVSVALLDQINVGTPGFVDLTDKSSLTMTPLLNSTRQTQLIASSELAGGPDPVKLLGNFESADTAYTIAARLTGSLQSAFPDGAPNIENAAEGKAPPQPEDHLAQTTGVANLVLVADSDLLDDMFWANRQDFFGQTVVIPIADNADFLINTVEQMTGSDALIALRSRGVSSRPFTAVDALRRQAELMFQAEEQALSEKLEQLQAQLDQLAGQAGSSDALVTEEQAQAEQSFRAELVATRAALRDVQLNLNRDIDRLEAWVAFVNIALMPLVLMIISGAIFLWSRRQKGAS